MLSLKTILAITLVFSLASDAFAQESDATQVETEQGTATAEKPVKVKEKYLQNATNKLLKPYEAASLTDEQKAQALELFRPEIRAYQVAKKTLSECLTTEQSQALKDAAKKIKTDGLKRKDAKLAREAAVDALGLSDEKRQAFEAAKMEMRAISVRMADLVVPLLTDEQKTTLPKPKWKKGGAGKNKGGEKKEAGATQAQEQ